MINARGTCREFVTVTRANVTLRGDPAAEIVVPRQDRDLPAVSADGVTLEKLTLAGRMTGLSQDHAPAFTARNCVIPDTSDIGVRVRFGVARFIGCAVQRSGGTGVSVLRGGSIVLSGSSQVLDGAKAGIAATRNSMVNFVGSTVMRTGAQGILFSEASKASTSNGSTSAEFATALVSVNAALAAGTGPRAGIVVWQLVRFPTGPRLSFGSTT